MKCFVVCFCNPLHLAKAHTPIQCLQLWSMMAVGFSEARVEVLNKNEYPGVKCQTDCASSFLRSLRSSFSFIGSAF